MLGSTGLLGTSLVGPLREAGYALLSHSRSGQADLDGDLTDPRIAGRVLAEAAPDVIVNLAGLTEVDDCERRPHHAYLLNVRIVENIAAWVRSSGAHSHLVQISTDQVYDGPGPHAEDDVRLSNCYAFSKYAGELAAAGTHSTILRTNFVGKSLRAGRRSLSDFVADALTVQRPTTVFADVQFSPLSLTTLVSLIIVVVEQQHPGIYNLGSRDGLSKADFAFALAEALGRSPACLRCGVSTDVTLAAYRPKDMRMNVTKFETTFGVTLPKFSEEIASLRAAYG